jgi:hypothetical protein
MSVETAPRRTEYIPLDHLIADPANPKSHSTETIDASIGRFGVIDQIVRDDRTGYIISGHGRHETLTAMRDRGETAPDGVRVDAGGHWLVPVVVGWASRTDAEARAALIALNRTTELGGWVDDELLGLLDDLSNTSTLDGVGYGDDDIEALRTRLAEEALVDSFTQRQKAQEDADGDTDLGKIDLTGDVREITVVIPADRYADFYLLMSETEWVKDVRDKTT